MTWRPYLSVLLLMVLCARSLLPTGFMVQAAAPDSGDMLEVVICTGSGLQLVSLDEDKPAPSKSQHVEPGLCAFAAAAAAAIPVAGPPSLAQAADFAAVTYTLAVALFAETPMPGATSARGPPLLLI